MGRDIHKTPFDEGTKAKLALYENYIKEWLPVFLSRTPIYTKINIFDFFSGPGKDETGCKGSPLITIDLLQPYLSNIIGNKQQVTLFFNDNRKKKVRTLQEHVSALNPESHAFEIICTSNEFNVAFREYLPKMSESGTANFLFLDQNGIKHITDDVFLEIINLPATDFLFFTSSSTLSRFTDHPEIKKYIDIPSHEITASNYYHIHRHVIDYYWKLIPNSREYYLAPFSIKKGANIYGLIFGTGHLLGLDKFVNQCWKLDPQTGDSNYDIDQDNINPQQPSLFREFNIPKKVQLFENELEKAILKGKVKSNKDIYRYTLTSGIKPANARSVINGLIRDGKMPKQKLNVSYNSCKVGTEEQRIKLK
ncbi:MAG: three-Cys-motif partner protein TcmP [Deltaproteobacteria bacterium]|nr:three-Cys-motif partner protein TcmP [Deltaproteobacteria bacterium]